MATNIIDAFLVTFGIDPSGYKSGAREIRDGNKQLREDTKQTFDGMEDRGKKAADTFRSVRNEVAGLLLVFAGGKSLTDFASSLLTGAANADRLGQTLGLSASRVTAWQEAIKSVGGSAGDADAALQAMQNTIMQWRLNPTQVNPGLLAFGISPSDMEKGPEELLMKLAAGRDKFSAPQYASRLQMLGLPQNMIFLLEKGPKAVDDLVKAQERNANVTDRDAKAAEKFQESLAKLQATIAGNVRPQLTLLIESLTAFLDKGGGASLLAPIIAGGIVAIGVAALGALGPLGLLVGILTAVAVKLGALEGLPKVPDAIAVTALKAEAKYHHFRSWLAEKNGNKDLAIREKRAELQALQQIDTIQQQNDAATSGGQAAVVPSGGGTGGNQHVIDYLTKSGFSGDQAAGIAAGIGAEGGGLGAAPNGAFGIGQWRGQRAKRLHQMFGAAPTLDQQLAFLVWELRGGDAGGPSVTRGTTAADTATRYLRDFMRPGPGLSGDLRRAGHLLGAAHRVGATGVTIHGGVHVHTKATDAAGIAKDMHGALRKRSAVLQADSGLAP